MKKQLFLLTAILILGSCTEPIDIEVDPSFKRLIVEGGLTTDTTKHLVKLTRSADYFSGEKIPVVADAFVYIIEGFDTTFLNEDSAGYYYTPADFYGKQNTYYELVIENVDIDADGEKEIYRARDQIRYVSPIDSITLELADGGPFNDDFFQILLWANEPPDKNFYIFKAQINGVGVRDSLLDWNLSNDDFFNGNYTYGVPVQWFDQEDTTESLKPGDIVTLELYQITREYYNFLNGAYNESFGSIPLFSGPPANIVGNVSNGAIGFFSCTAVTRSSTVVKTP
jgi:hypothetical protein